MRVFVRGATDAAAAFGAAGVALFGGALACLRCPAAAAAAAAAEHHKQNISHCSSQLPPP